MSFAETHSLHELAQRFQRVRASSLALTEPLSEADAQVQSMPDASPAKWHLAHTTWFFETMVLEAAEPDFVAFHPAFRTLFNSYYHGVGEQHARAQRGLVTRPGLAEVMDYRRAVDARVLALLAQRPARRLPDDVELGPAARAAAPGTDPHRPAAPAVVQPLVAGLPARHAGAAGRGPAARSG